MKEATGELNATVVVVITIGILSTFFFTIIWPRLKGNLNANTKCASAICKVEKGKLEEVCTEHKNGVCSKIRCTYYESKNDKKGIEIICPYKG